MRHDSWGVSQYEPGGGVKNLTARIAPDMLGSKMGMKRVPVRALKVPTISNSTVFRGEAIREDARLPEPSFWLEMPDFRADFFLLFFCRIIGDHVGTSLTGKKVVRFCTGVWFLLRPPKAQKTS